MEVEQLYQLIENPALLTDSTLPVLKELTKRYPSFHTARMLYLKNLAVTNSASFAEDLNHMAVSIPDRRKLYRYITEAEEELPEQKEATRTVLDDTFLLIDSFLSSQSEQPVDESSVLIQPSVSTDYIYWAYSKGLEAEEPEKEETRFKHHELIDSFLENEYTRPRLTEPGEQHTGQSDVSSIEGIEATKSLDDSYFTETLARIYIKQRRYERALQIIRNLSLKYPEKNIYFADQIRFLEKLIINTQK